jgi:uncharacterized membrane protein YtjA (UPF0391 family)
LERDLLQRSQSQKVDEEKELIDMLHWSLIFLVIALIAGALGFGGIAGAAAGIAKILFVVFLLIWLVVFLTIGRVASK